MSFNIQYKKIMIFRQNDTKVRTHKTKSKKQKKNNKKTPKNRASFKERRLTACFYFWNGNYLDFALHKINK